MKNTIIFIFLLFFISYLCIIPYIHKYYTDPNDILRYKEIKMYNEGENKIFLQYDAYSKYIPSEAISYFQLIEILIKQIDEICDLLISDKESKKYIYENKLNELLKQKKFLWSKFKSYLDMDNKNFFK